jgi:predicted transcriptional regulator
MEEADLLALRRLLVLTTKAVGAETTNAEALRMMLADGVDSIVKTDPRGRPIGIVRREVIVSQLLVKLAGE